MTLEGNNDPKLKFPVVCPYRIITLDIPNIQFVIETVLSQLGITAPITKGNASSQGKYISHTVDILVDSREMMGRIQEELSAIEGVRMIL